MKYLPFSIIPKSSTRVFWQTARKTHNYSFLDLLHGYIYARWPYFYIGVGTGEYQRSKVLLQWFIRFRSHISSLISTVTVNHVKEQNSHITFADNYHGKVVPLEPASQLVMIRQAIDLPNLEHVIPYKRAKDIIMSNPDHIVALDCPCRVTRQSPCLPLDVCIIVGEPFASFVIEHHPSRAHWISREEAEKILREEDERGHVHHAFFKDAMLGRFYAICNCCSCCCGAMQAHHNGTPMLASSGYICQVDESICCGCGNCVAYCQFKALSISNEYLQVNIANCMGCGVCVSKCDQGALSLLRDETKSEPLDIVELVGSDVIVNL